MANIIEVPGMGRVEFPDGMSDAQIEAAIKANLAPAKTPAMQASRAVGQGAIGINDALATTFGAPGDVIGWGMRQLGLPANDPMGGSENLKRGLDRLATVPGRIRDSVYAGPRDPAREGQSPFTEDRTSRFEPEGRLERYANAGGEAIGTVASMLLPAGAVAGAARAGGMTQGIASALASGPKTQVASALAGNLTSEATGNPLLGAGVGLAMPFALHGVARLGSAAPARGEAEIARRGLVETARENKIPLSAGDITGSDKLRTFESWVDKTPLPFLGGRQTALQGAKQEGFNKALLATAGENATAASDNVLEKMFSRIGGQFDNLAKSTTITVDPQFGADMAKVEAEYGRQLFATMKKGTIDKMDELASAARAAGQPGNVAVTVDGDIYKNIRSGLSKETLSADPHVRDAAVGMINALDGALGRSLPKDMAKDWSEARRMYRNAVTIRDAVQARNNPNTAIGNIPPAAIASRSESNRDLHPLAEVGNAFVGDKIPNSGTAQRSMLNALLLGGGGGMATGVVSPTQALYAAGAAAAPYAADLAINNPATRAALMARYRNAGPGAVNRGLVASLLAQEGIQDGPSIFGARR